MIKNVDFESSIQEAFLEYGAAVAQERSIADVRDGLKLGMRQGLYAQYTNKLTHSKPYKKATKSVAAAMAQSYTHGDVSIYDAFVRAAKPWAMRYPIEDAQGTVGSPCAPDDHTAMRYLELRAGEIADYFFDGLKKNAIGDEWYDNYDDTEKIPNVFPSIGFWNIVNGCTGIAVAMSTSVPQLNLREVNTALTKLIKNPDISFDDIYCPPDFATGGTITNAREVKESMRTGHGSSIRLRADIEYHQKEHMLVATHLPYGVYTNTVIGQIAEITEQDENYGIAKVIDHTKKVADIRIYLTKDAVPSVVIQKLYHDTSLESWFGINMIMLDQGRFPKVFGWREACQAYIDHIRICKRRELEFDVGTLNARNHILDGLLIALASIEDVIATIKNSESASAAKTNLMTKYGLSEIQAQAILDLKLQRLAHMEAMKIEKELNENRAKLEELNNILATPALLDDILVQILEDVAKKYGDARRTKITNVLAEEEVEEPEVPVMLRIKDGKIMPTSKKLSGEIITTTNKETLIAFTSSNRMFKAAVKDIPANGISVNNLFKTTGILAINTLSNLKAGTTIHSLTSNGYIKKTNTKDYSWPPRINVALFKMSDGDTIKGISFNELTTVKVITDTGERTVDFSNVRETTKFALGTRIFGRQENNHIKQIEW